ncbi:dihydrodipicolinate synthase family protein [Nonomuraea sp. NEAU-A123]|uniref:dihydrodipicolinate synthase family protein n=1 Tax=Nonomuraea sp. NEAU-A123 TaxID=2839649 RepID=UPI001BE41210|nr:dihydrodipicolinate synthase family protein [Nonomuraea sp. NEAU-A123]MBT2232344.1 dihydrodipicolinate synthase family protein [Nonomuraea sp. NEAU-A123]
MATVADPSDHPVAGVIIPLVTALDRRGRPDPPAVRPLLAHLAAGGVTTLMLAGTNGEGPLLPADAVRTYAVEVAAMWRELAGASARIMVTAAGTGTRETLQRMECLDGLDLDAVVVLAPSYFRHTERELHAHFRDAAGHGRPVVIYNSPGYTGNPIPVSLIRRLLEEPAIVGLKDSSGNTTLFAEFCALARERPAFQVAQGTERQLAEGLRLGAAGLVPGVGMLAPALCVDLLKAGRDGDHAAAAARQGDVDRLAALFAIRPASSGIVVIKTALHELGLCPPHAAAPFLPLTESELTALRSALAPLRDLVRPDALRAARQPE